VSFHQAEIIEVLLLVNILYIVIMFALKNVSWMVLSFTLTVLSKNNVLKYRNIMEIRKIVAILLISTLSACNMQQKLWVPDWKETSTLAVPRAGAAIVAVEGTIYLIGGVDGQKFLDTTEFAKISKDGSLGAWQQGTQLNEARGFIDAVEHNGYIYVVGGGNGPNGHHLLRTTERARILPDGSLGPWETEKSEMKAARRCSKVIATNTALFTFGGFGGSLLDTVERAEFLPDGSLGEWKLESKTMLMPRYVNGVKKFGSSAYVIGGHDQNRGVGITDVEWSSLEDKNNLHWKATQPMLTGRYGLSTVAHKKYIYALGGLTGLEYLESIEKSKVNADGQLSAWQMTTPLDVPRAMFSVVEYKDWIYVVGGTSRERYLTSVVYATTNENADFGYWGSEADQKAFKVKLAERQKSQSTLPNQGTVLSVLQASAYTYVEVADDDQQSIWLAGPKLDIQPKDRVGFSMGVVMSGFYSKELDRTFNEILFVGQLKKIEQ